MIGVACVFGTAWLVYIEESVSGCEIRTAKGGPVGSGTSRCCTSRREGSSVDGSWIFCGMTDGDSVSRAVWDCWLSVSGFVVTNAEALRMALSFSLNERVGVSAFGKRGVEGALGIFWDISDISALVGTRCCCISPLWKSLFGWHKMLGLTESTLWCNTTSVDSTDSNSDLCFALRNWLSFVGCEFGLRWKEMDIVVECEEYTVSWEFCELKTSLISEWHVRVSTKMESSTITDFRAAWTLALGIGSWFCERFLAMDVGGNSVVESRMLLGGLATLTTSWLQRRTCVSQTTSLSMLGTCAAIKPSSWWRESGISDLDGFKGLEEVGSGLVRSIEWSGVSWERVHKTERLSHCRESGDNVSLG